MNNEYISLMEASRQLGVSKQYLYQLADEGKITVKIIPTTVYQKAMPWKEFQQLREKRKRKMERSTKKRKENVT